MLELHLWTCTIPWTTPQTSTSDRALHVRIYTRDANPLSLNAQPKSCTPRATFQDITLTMNLALPTLLALLGSIHLAAAVCCISGPPCPGVAPELLPSAADILREGCCCVGAGDNCDRCGVSFVLV